MKKNKTKLLTDILNRTFLGFTILSFIFACGKSQNASDHRSRAAAHIENDLQEQEPSAHDQSKKIASAGDLVVEEVSVGYSPSPHIGKENIVSQSEIQEHKQEPLFEYKEPESAVQVEFSQPVMVTGSYLTLLMNDNIVNFIVDCAAVRYSTVEPKFEDLLGQASGSYRFCIRFQLGGVTETYISPEIVYVSAEPVVIPSVVGEGSNEETTETETETETEPTVDGSSPTQEEPKSPKPFYLVAPEDRKAGFYYSFDHPEKIISDGADLSVRPPATEAQLVSEGYQGGALLFDGIDDFLHLTSQHWHLQRGPLKPEVSVNKFSFGMSFYDQESTSSEIRLLLQIKRKPAELIVYLKGGKIYTKIKSESDLESDHSSTSHSVVVGDWNHFEFMVDVEQQSLRTVLNGELVQASMAHAAEYFIWDWRLGGSVNNKSNYLDLNENFKFFNGKIDNVYMRVLDHCNDLDYDGLCEKDDPCPSDPFNDLDKDGVCGMESLCEGDKELGALPLNLLAKARTVEYDATSVKFKDADTNFIRAKAGEALELNFKWHLGETECPGCVVQNYVGFANQRNSSQCVWSGGASTGAMWYPFYSSPYRSVSLTAPMEKGLHFVSFADAWAYDCVESYSALRRSHLYLAAVCVE